MIYIWLFNLFQPMKQVLTPPPLPCTRYPDSGIENHKTSKSMQVLEEIKVSVYENVYSKKP